MPGVGNGPDQLHVDACRDEAGLERRLEHVARQPRVLADERRAAVRREHAGRGAREPQRELDRHRVLADLPADAVGAEIFPAHARFAPVPRAACRAARSFSRRCRRARGDLHRIDRRRDVVRAHDLRTRSTHSAASVALPTSALAGGPARDHTDQRLARDADQQRAAEIRERAQVPQQRRGCAAASCRTRCPDRRRSTSAAMPAARQAATRSTRNSRTSRDDVLVLRVDLHRRGLADACA